ncbi:Protein of unknown function DUF1754, eukaryotic [Ostreococcus tauri]|uniref:DUF1754-domain-containing protein n=1 Tax=Ostreococcus tauri TaxID=70448 RepID=A0A090N4R0_OSTTA|nr:Protein of unknown function DUF1754, eukaryotic [Ostreococcus tauri]CEG01145.1 Protein of unknown function DUF1754, eukaryotic [Ostreococcus tauri]|eukprot:XP_022840811.1 Protein of unknown function DUF1754, eukaryotic [Ostreococcus tauri]
MSDARAYDAVARGKLRLKRAGASTSTEGGTTSKRAKKRAKKTATATTTEGDERGTGDVGDRRTEAEKAYEEAYRKQHEARLVRELASKSHKDKVREFNEKLSKMSEHHDLPKIGPG